MYTNELVHVYISSAFHESRRFAEQAFSVPETWTIRNTFNMLYARRRLLLQGSGKAKTFWIHLVKITACLTDCNMQIGFGITSFWANWGRWGSQESQSQRRTQNPHISQCYNTSTRKVCRRRVLEGFSSEGKSSGSDGEWAWGKPGCSSQLHRSRESLQIRTPPFRGRRRPPSSTCLISTSLGGNNGTNAPGRLIHASLRGINGPFGWDCACVPPTEMTLLWDEEGRRARESLAAKPCSETHREVEGESISVLLSKPLWRRAATLRSVLY